MRFFAATGSGRTWWSVAMVLVAAVCVGLACVAYTNQVRRQADRRWCELLALQARPSPPPSTDRGWAQVRAYQELYDELGCQEEGD